MRAARATAALLAVSLLDAIIGSYLGLGAVSPAAADQVNLTPVKDNTLVQTLDGSLSNAKGNSFYVGRLRSGEFRRGVLAFGIIAAIDSGAATVDSVRLILHINRSHAVADIQRLHSLLADWGEGTSTTTGGQGDDSTPGDATWIHRKFPSLTWATAGGDFVASPSASQSVSGTGSYTWKSVTMTSDVQAWVDHPSTNFGWLLKGAETAFQSAKRYDSRESSSVSFRPTLQVFFTPHPTSVPIPDQPPMVRAFRLDPNVPNPFNPSTTLTYWLLQASPVRVLIVDVRGAVVASLAPGVQDGGKHSLIWDGRDARGQVCASGVYRVVLEADGEIRSRNITLLK